ncbi:MAG: dihydropteroate synthase [Methanomicrobiales archaeon]|nr:dihydropteroate synthase [Methanomicrobiales archaeon]
MHLCHIGPVSIGGTNPVRLMGVINCSPESFYSESFAGHGTINAAAERLTGEGAEVLDIGGRSTAPASLPVSIAEEKERVITALRELDGCGFTITVDTMHPEVLEAALQYGINGVNDISGLANPRMGSCVADQGIPAVLMAAVQQPGDAIGFDASLTALQTVEQRCDLHGIKAYVLDPGIGRWIPARTAENDWELCCNFSRFLSLQRPLLAAISRKSFVGDLLKKSPEERLSGSLALTTFLVQQGAGMVRTHDVAETRDVLSVCRRLRECR